MVSTSAMTSIMHAHVIFNVKHVVRDRAKEASTTIHQLVNWDELPTWMQTDPYIRRGYRRQMNSFHTCYQSLFYPHNEFVNTWSHLLPAVLYLVMLLGVDVKLFRYELQDVEVKASDMRVVQLYILGTVILLLCSVRQVELFFFADSMVNADPWRYAGFLPWN